MHDGIRRGLIVPTFDGDKRKEQKIVDDGMELSSLLPRDWR
jgi:hypothetical protein